MNRYHIDWGNTTATITAETLYEAMRILFMHKFSDEAWSKRYHQLGRTYIPIGCREACAHCIE